MLKSGKIWNVLELIKYLQILLYIDFSGYYKKRSLGFYPYRAFNRHRHYRYIGGDSDSDVFELRQQGKGYRSPNKLGGSIYGRDGI